jgi:hypothetical protein
MNDSRSFDFHRPGFIATVTIQGQYPYSNEDLDAIAKLYYASMMLDLV